MRDAQHLPKSPLKDNIYSHLKRSIQMEQSRIETCEFKNP